VIRFASSGRLAVLEHDDFAVMAGVPRTHEQTAGLVWHAALHAMAASARAYLETGLAVLVIVNYGRERRRLLEQLLAPAPVRQVLLLPDWEVNRTWTVERMHGAAAPDLPHIGWDAHKKFHDDLVAMSSDGLFDEVINPDSFGLDEIVDRLAWHLGLAEGVPQLL
jgi:hypothetical protein